MELKAPEGRARQEIYVADGGRQNLPAFDRHQTWNTLAGNLSAPTALSFDPNSGRLYIADPGCREIFTLDTRSNKAALGQFASGQMQAPIGLTLPLQNRLSVVEYIANSVLVFSKDGVLLFPSTPN